MSISRAARKAILNKPPFSEEEKARLLEMLGDEPSSPAKLSSEAKAWLRQFAPTRPRRSSKT